MVLKRGTIALMQSRITLKKARAMVVWPGPSKEEVEYPA